MLAFAQGEEDGRIQYSLNSGSSVDRPRASLPHEPTFMRPGKVAEGSQRREGQMTLAGASRRASSAAAELHASWPATFPAIEDGIG